MALPGFTAERALVRSVTAYCGTAGAALDPATVRIAVGPPQPVPCVPSCRPGAPRQCCSVSPGGTYQCLTVVCPPPTCEQRCAGLTGKQYLTCLQLCYQARCYEACASTCVANDPCCPIPNCNCKCDMEGCSPC
jgi:hypothetical protein